MNLIVKHLVPIPLKERLENRHSDIWNNVAIWQDHHSYKIKAASGTGKTTLIHYLYGLRNDYEGQVIWYSKPIEQYTAEEMATLRQEKVSIVFQDLRLFPQLTAFENINLNRLIKGYYGHEKIIHHMAEILGITHILQQKAGICSYGEQQRIAIIRAMMQPFEWLLLDEPFSHLDEANSRKAAQLIFDECLKRRASIVLADLDDDQFLSYHQQYDL